MIRVDPAVEVLPRGSPRVRDLYGLVIARIEATGLPVGTDLAEVVTLRLPAPLDDIVGVEAILRGVLAVLVDGEDLRDLAHRVVVPRPIRAVGHRVLAVPLVRRLLETGLLEQARLVEERRRVES